MSGNFLILMVVFSQSVLSYLRVGVMFFESTRSTCEIIGITSFIYLSSLMYFKLRVLMSRQLDDLIYFGVLFHVWTEQCVGQTP